LNFKNVPQVPQNHIPNQLKINLGSPRDHPGGPRITQRSSKPLQGISRTSKMIPKATKSYPMEDPTPGEGPAAVGEALKIRRTPFRGSWAC